MKCQHPVEQVGLRNKVKASKLSIDPITLTEGDLHDISKMLHDVTNEALQDLIQENQIVLGALRAQLQDLQVCSPQVGTLSTNLTVGSMTIEQMLRVRMTNKIVLLKGALMTSNEAEKPLVSMLKSLCVNIATLPHDTLYVLQDWITAELRARESRVLQVLSE